MDAWQQARADFERETGCRFEGWTVEDDRNLKPVCLRCARIEHPGGWTVSETVKLHCVYCSRRTWYRMHLEESS